MTVETSALQAARRPHRGVFITGPGRLELLEDTLPDGAFGPDQIITRSLGNCRCSSDKKAIVQFTRHARIPANATRVALGHEAIHQVLTAPAGSPVEAGDLVLITPGHFSSPHNPDTFEPDPEHGVIASLGYSYRYVGGLRQYNALPVKAIEVVREQGFGKLFNIVRRHPDVSLATLAHAEPFACCFGTMKNMFYVDGRGEFNYGLPPGARVAFLGGTARMAMIKLTILASRPGDEIPGRVTITGSQRKLDELEHYELIRGLRRRGVELHLLDRSAPDLLDRLRATGSYNAVFTNYPSQEVFDQAVALVEPGGNLNNYAGALDPDISFTMCIPEVVAPDDVKAEARAQLMAMHHNVSPNDHRRHRGIAREPRVGLFGLRDRPERLRAYLGELPSGAEVQVSGGVSAELARDFPRLKFIDELPAYSDLFIAGSGEAPAALYREVELLLARNAAVNFVDGGTTIRIRSRHTHYTTRHQICGPTVPFNMTNTSEPISEDIAIQGDRPIDFDWLVKGVAGLAHTVEMIEDVNAREPFGSFFAMPQVPDFPYVAVDSEAFRARAGELRVSGTAPSETLRALESAAEILDANGESWSREVERAIYVAYGVPYPLDE